MTKTFSGFVGNVLRYSVASVGPVSAAGVQFVMSLVLLRALTPGDFGSYSFLMVTSQFSTGLWGALFCAPLPVLLSRGSRADRDAVLRSLFAANAVTATVAFTLFVVIGAWLGVPVLESLLFAAYTAMSLLRWFGRTYAYATGGPFKTMLSDIVYSATVLAGTGVAVFSGVSPLPVCYAAILLGTLGGMFPFGWRYLSQQFAPVSLASLAGYGAIWRKHSGWSLAGVVTTEATTNAHAYIVTAMFGPSAFAAVAASGLMIRPVQVAMNALTEFERAQMARQIGAGHLAAAREGARFFRSMLIAAWVATAIAIAVLVSYAPNVLFPAQYNASRIGVGIALWMAVAGVRLLRTPESVLLQAGGAFRALAYASMISSGISIVAVFALVGRGGAIWSIAGILVGETVLAGCVWIQARRWLNRDEAGLGRWTPAARAAAPASLALLVSDDSVRP